MTVERWLRLIAGFLVMLSLGLGYWVDPKWHYFTAFVGANLFQSAFTDWCPMMSILKRLGVSHAESRRRPADPRTRDCASCDPTICSK